MAFSARPDQWHHKLTRISLIFLSIGILINVVLSLVEGDDIGFFSANAVFTSITAILLCTALVTNLTKDFNFFCFMGLLALLNFIFCIQPIKMWTDEGNLCSGLSAEEQQIGRECYSAALGAVGNKQTSSFDNLIGLVTTCYSNNNILTSSSGVCYNIRWRQSDGNTIRAFMLISWLCQFFGTLIALGCSFQELLLFGQLQLKRNRIECYIQEATLLVFRDLVCDDPRKFNELSELLRSIKEKERSD